ncbi:prepilin-type N-terminal cleavage/methylation domain-containing protein [Desulfococcaceae bacterium HSG7]|nr:prepilin-type N-terminal cleavage/methylation domain-containing protein [Desulfococcaceae bacterium HSG7]
MKSNLYNKLFNINTYADFSCLFTQKNLIICGMAIDKRSFEKTKGFTLIELMLVIAIIGTLAAIAMLSYNVYIDQAKITRTIVEIKNIENMIAGYEIDNGKLPESLTDLGMGILVDPWSNPYEYYEVKTKKGKGKQRRDKSWNPLNDDYDLYSCGPDGKTQQQANAKYGRDDIIRAANGQRIALGKNL